MKPEIPHTIIGIPKNLKFVLICNKTKYPAGNNNKNEKAGKLIIKKSLIDNFFK